jgi:two-component system NarL family response regulator
MEMMEFCSSANHVTGTVAERLREGNHRLRVLAVDEHPVVCEGLSALLSRQPDLEIVAWVRPADLSQNFEKLCPDITFVDFASAPFDILKTIASILHHRPSAKIVVFTTSICEEHVYTAMQVGVKGYLHKSSLLSEILACIYAVSHGETWIPANIRDVLKRRGSAFNLTKRERDVLFAMAVGRSNKEIGLALGMTEGTVKVHVTHILGKLKVGGRTEALAVAAARGLVSWETMQRLSRKETSQDCSVSSAIAV